MVEIKIRPASVEQNEYLAKLARVCGYKGEIAIMTIASDDMPSRMGVTDDPHGFLHIEPGKPMTIVLAEDTPENRWQSLIAHEFLHALRWDLDEFVFEHIREKEWETYMMLVESAMKPLSILLMVGGMVNAEWVEEE